MVHLDAIPVAELLALETHDVAVAVGREHIIETVVLHDLLCLPAANATIATAIDRVIVGVIATTIVVAIAATIAAETKTDIDIRLRLGRRRHNNRSSQRGGGNHNLREHKILLFS